MKMDKVTTEQALAHCIDLTVLRGQGYIVEIEMDEASPFLAKNVYIIAKNTIKGTVLKDEVAAELEQTYGIKKTNNVQKRAVKMINDLMFQDALKRATK
jgi:hypothetical protein